MPNVCQDWIEKWQEVMDEGIITVDSSNGCHTLLPIFILLQPLTSIEWLEWMLLEVNTTANLYIHFVHF